MAHPIIEELRKVEKVLKNGNGDVSTWTPADRTVVKARIPDLVKALRQLQTKLET